MPWSQTRCSGVKLWWLAPQSKDDADNDDDNYEDNDDDDGMVNAGGRG